jgi:hypothetical protein
MVSQLVKILMLMTKAPNSVGSKPVQSLHHGSVGYQPVHTRIGLAKNSMSLQANQEHKQE